jgi:hypothetical protein
MSSPKGNQLEVAPVSRSPAQVHPPLLSNTWLSLIVEFRGRRNQAAYGGEQVFRAVQFVAFGHRGNRMGMKNLFSAGLSFAEYILE